ncbi:urease accessory protein UreD [Planktotalea sp.]|uniref:urease accessory protein UreD n=1 Tax=Planktotalea sp. TaxID=2029877 RepID=UPI0032970132
MAVQPRAIGNVVVSAKSSATGSVLDQLRQSGSSKVLFPRSAAKRFETVILNTAGGVTGGDRFSVSVEAGADTVVTASTQAFERAYKAQPDQIGRINNQLKIGSNARMNWLPQETILFDGSSIERRLMVKMAANASFLMVEPLVFGRAAMGEVLRHATFKDRIEITRDGVPIYLDAMTLKGDIHAHLANPFVANGAGAMASVVYVGRDAEAHLAPLRDLLPETAGASLILEDVLALRLLAEDSFALRQTLIPVLHRLNNGALPRCWTI